MDKLVLIDGHSILNRAFYGVPDALKTECRNRISEDLRVVLRKFDCQLGRISETGID